jgi:hypothetical protein
MSERPSARASGFGRAIGLAAAAAGLVVLAVVLLSVASDFWILFLAVPLFAIWLVLSAILAPLLTAVLVRCVRRPLTAKMVMASAATLTLLLFAALPLYIVLFAPAHDGGLLFH